MSQSSFGKKFVVTTWGESHGKAIGAVLDGCPAGLSLCEEDIQVFLVDIGLPQLAMHSAYETAGVKDTESLIRAAKVFYR